MFRLAWRDVRHHPVRFGMSLLAVVLGVSFVAGTFAFRSMLASTFDGIISSSMGADVFVSAKSDNPLDLTGITGAVPGLLPDTLVEPISQLDEVKWAQAEYQGPITLVGANGTRVTSAGAPSFGMGFVEDLLLDQGFAITGHAPVGPGEIVLEEQTATRAGLAIGDSTKVLINTAAPVDVEVVGMIASQEGTVYAGAVIVGLDEAIAKAAYAPTGAVPTITARAADGVSQDELAAAIRTILPADSNAVVVTGQQAQDTARESINSMLGFMSTFLLIFAAIALFIGAFIIANTFAMVVRQRLRESALLRALGASPRQVIVSFVAQAGIVGLFGAVLGIGGGFGLVAIIRRLLDHVGMPLSGAIPVSLPGILIPMALGVAVSMVAAALPARRAGRVAPVEAMRPGGPPEERRLLLRGATGAVLSVAGVTLLVAAHRAANDGGALLGAGAAVLLLGLIVVAPVLGPGVTRVLGIPFSALSRPFGKLAQRNLTRNKRRTANTAAALMIGMALVGATAVISSSTSASVSSLVEEQLAADFILDGQESVIGIPAAALDEMREIDGIKVMPFGAISGVAANAKASGSPNPHGEGGLFGEPPWIASGDPEVLTKGFTMEIVDGRAEDFGTGLCLHEAFASDHDVAVGDLVSVTIAPDTPYEVTTELPVQVIVASAATSMRVTISEETLAQLVPAEALEQLVTYPQAVIALDPGVDATEVREQLNAIVAPYYTIGVMDGEEFTDFIAGQIRQMLNILYGLLALSLIIAVLGVINTLALSVIERTQEIGMTRAVGLGRGQLAWTMVIEGILIALFGAVLGIGAGVGITAILPSVAASMGLGVLAIPWAAIVGLFVGAAAVGVVAAVWPAIRASRVPILQALAYE
ncbi:MAG: ABC transporter permease [Micrococcales bacterium]|nr:ABC transporter permease [Micrococcales bacterium]